jgi:hypothetical protein
MSGDSSNAKPNAILKVFDSTPTFVDFTRRVLGVPHSTIKARLDAEKEAKLTSKSSAFRVSGASSKRAD